MSLMTKLEAVNRMLDAIGEEPVSSLASGLDDAEAAERILLRTSREVQARGWYVNREENLRLAPDVNGYLLVPDGTLSVKPTGHSKHIRAVQRDGKLYNVKDRTFSWTSAIYVDLITAYDFEELTFPLQNYISALAARKFQESILTSVAVDGFTNRQVNEAWAELLHDEAVNDRTNILTDPAVMNLMSRRNRLRGL